MLVPFWSAKGTNKLKIAKIARRHHDLQDTMAVLKQSLEISVKNHGFLGSLGAISNYICNFVSKI